MKETILVSTMFCDNPIDLINRMNIHSDSIIINQCNCKKDERVILKNNGYDVTYICTNDRGLSKSRNKALDNLPDNVDVVIFTDDDIKFNDGYKEKIQEVYKNDNIDGCVFNVKRTNGRLNKRLGKYINRITMFRVCSVSMTFKYESIKNLRFDEEYGAGSGKYVLGEENIFMNECLKRKLRIVNEDFIMCNICDCRPSTWYSGMNSEVLYAKGACFKKIFPVAYILFDIDFLIRKYKEYKKNISISNAYRSIINGNKSVKKEK